MIALFQFLIVLSYLKKNSFKIPTLFLSFFHFKIIYLL